MRRIWQSVNWLAFTALPAFLVYFTDLGGFATRLDKALSSVAPIVGAFLPFIAIGLVTACLGIVVPRTYLFDWKLYIDWRYDLPTIRKFQRSLNSIRTCKQRLANYDPIMALMRSKKDHVDYITILNDLQYLSKSLEGLGISTPSLNPSGVNLDPDQRWLIFLSHLEVIAQHGDIKGAKELYRKLGGA